MSSRFVTPGFESEATHGARAGLGVRHRAGDLAAHDVGRVEQPDHPTVHARGRGLAHLPRRVLEVHHPRPGCRRDDLGHGEHRAVRVVEAHRQVARQLDVLALVVADGHARRPVEQDVGRHQGRVGVQRDPGRRLVLALLLVLDHPRQLTGVRRALEQVGQLAVGRHVGLPEQHRTSGVEADGEEQRGDLGDGVAQHARVVVVVIACRSATP